MDDSVRIEEAAAAWLARRDGGNWTSADQAALDAWLANAIGHRVAFIRLEAAWQRTRRLKALGAMSQAGAVPEPGSWKELAFFARRAEADAEAPSAAPSLKDRLGARLARMEVSPAAPALNDSQAFKAKRRTAFRAIAAVALLAVTASLSWHFWPNGTSYRTEVGALAAVPMPDGSRVTLNTNSDVRVAVSPTEREVELQRGEAFFEVVKDPQRPFVVRVADKRVVAVGTKFSVRREADDVRVVVTEGQVRVEWAGYEDPPPIAMVSAGSVARAGAAGVVVDRKSLAETDELLSWRSGFLVFHETPLSDVVAEFNRYNARKIVIDDPSIGATRIGGSFRYGNAEAFVRLLAEGLPIRVEKRGGAIVLTRQ